MIASLRKLELPKYEEEMLVTMAGGVLLRKRLWSF
jgi:hypothetical protein